MLRPQHLTRGFRQLDTKRNPYPHINPGLHVTCNNPLHFSNISRNLPNPSISHPPRHISNMADPLDKVLDKSIFNLEWMTSQRQNQATPETLEELLKIANDFLGLRETMSPMGTTFVDRLTKALEKIRKLVLGGDLRGLEDFIYRQKRVTIEADLVKLKVCRCFLKS